MVALSFKYNNAFNIHTPNSVVWKQDEHRWFTQMIQGGRSTSLHLTRLVCLSLRSLTAVINTRRQGDSPTCLKVDKETPWLVWNLTKCLSVLPWDSVTVQLAKNWKSSISDLLKTWRASVDFLKLDKELLCFVSNWTRRHWLEWILINRFSEMPEPRSLSDLDKETL